MFVNYYNVLAVHSKCSKEEIDISYFDLGVSSHPKNPAGGDTIDRFCLITEAYLILSDPAARSRYDRRLNLESTLKEASKENTIDLSDPLLNGWISTARAQAGELASMEHDAFLNRLLGLQKNIKQSKLDRQIGLASTGLIVFSLPGLIYSSIYINFGASAVSLVILSLGIIGILSLSRFWNTSNQLN